MVFDFIYVRTDVEVNNCHSYAILMKFEVCYGTYWLYGRFLVSLVPVAFQAFFS